MYDDTPPAATVRTQVPVPLRFADGYATAARVFSFDGLVDGREHIAFGFGAPREAGSPLVRLHSECLTGDVLGSLRCDCRDQLGTALERIAQEPCGVLLYLRQEGRGIGLLNKVRAYALQDRGLDTVDANIALGFRDDERDYAVAAHMLASLTLRSVRLLTNNPRKVEELVSYGIRVTDRIPHVIPANEHNRFYLETKANRSGHFIDFEGKPHVAEQDDPVLVAPNLARSIKRCQRRPR